jgi:CheY-like chemotaxis protein
VDTILIVEDDGLVAGQMARTLRQAGHVLILAPNARSAPDEAVDRLGVILLDLGLPDLPVEELVERLQSQPDTARLPVLVVKGKRGAAAHLREEGRVADVLLKPLSGVKLREAGVGRWGQPRQRRHGPQHWCHGSCRHVTRSATPRWDRGRPPCARDSIQRRSRSGRG